jgi:hypothetical protein
MNFSCKKWNIFYNFKVKYYFCVLDAPNGVQPIVVVEIDSSCAVNKIHATHFWETTLSTLGGFIECGNGFDL